MYSLAVWVLSRLSRNFITVMRYKLYEQRVSNLETEVTEEAGEVVCPAGVSRLDSSGTPLSGFFLQILPHFLKIPVDLFSI